MKGRISVGLLAVAIIMAGYGDANATTIDVSVSGLEALGSGSIWSYQLEFSITGSPAGINVIFDTTRQHLREVAPGTKVVNWNLDANVTDAPLLVVLADDNSLGVDSPLVNGSLFSISYSDGTTLGLSFESFLLSSDLVTPVDMLASGKLFGAGEHQLVFTPAAAVPIPPAGLLAASGLIGMLILRRWGQGSQVKSPNY